MLIGKKKTKLFYFQIKEKNAKQNNKIYVVYFQATLFSVALFLLLNSGALFDSMSTYPRVPTNPPICSRPERLQEWTLS